jgi:hypothetical protein
MTKVLIKGLEQSEVKVFLMFMESKIKDEHYINEIETSGNDCDIKWMEDGMDISNDDMIHELFEIYGTSKKHNDSLSSEENVLAYELVVNDVTFQTFKTEDEWEDEYYIK